MTKYSPIRILIVAMAALLASLTASSIGVSQTIAYTDATLETLSDQGRIENGTLVTRDGKIVAVGADVKVPDDARVVSMSGKTIIPGLIDPYFVFKQTASSNSRTVTFNGRTFTIPGSSAFSVGSFTKIGEYFYPYDFDFKPGIRSGITVGNLVSDGRGLSALANLTDERTPEMLFKTDGFLFAQLTNQTSALDIIRKPLTPTPARGGSTTTSTSTRPTSTSSTRTGSSSASSSTDDTKELWNAVKEGKAPLFVNVNNAATVAYVLQIIKEQKKVKLILVSTGANLYELLDDIEANKNVTVVLQPGIESVPYSNDLMNVSQLLAERGIPFAISMSLSKSQLESSQDDPMFPLAMLVKTGLDRETALKAVTITPAQLLEIEKTHGSLEKDKQANFLVFDGDPLETGSRLEKVILNGSTIHEN